MARDELSLLALREMSPEANGVLSVDVAFAPAISRLVFSTPDYTELVRIVLLGLGFNLPAEFGFSFLRLHNRARAFTGITIARTLANVALNVALLTVQQLDRDGAGDRCDLDRVREPVVHDAARRSCGDDLGDLGQP